MRQLRLAFLLGLLCSSVMFLFGEDPILLPEKIPFKIAWDHDQDGDPTIFYRLMAGTNLVTDIKTNQFQLSSTNGITTATATITNAIPRGTNVLTLIAVSGIYTNETSDPSNPVVIRILGKPLAPQGIRKL